MRNENDLEAPSGPPIERAVRGLIGEHYVTYGKVRLLATTVMQSPLAESSFVDRSKQSIDLNRAIGNRAVYLRSINCNVSARS